MATRRLPVIQEPTGEDAEAAARPPWQWVMVGSGLLVTIWTPSVALVLAIARKIAASAAAGGAAPGPMVGVALVVMTFGLAGLAAGYLVARFGVRTKPRHAVFAGLTAAAEIWLVALLGGAFAGPVDGISALLSLSALAAGFCALGSRLARRKKPSA